MKGRLLLAIAALAASSSVASAEAWQLKPGLQGNATQGRFVGVPPVCGQKFGSKQEVIDCLAAAKWPLGHYMKSVGSASGPDRTDVYGVVQETFMSVSFNACSTVSGSYGVVGAASVCAFTGVPRLVDTVGNRLVNNDQYFWFPRSNADNLWCRGYSSCSTSYWEYGVSSASFVVAQYPNEQPDPVYKPCDQWWEIYVPATDPKPKNGDYIDPKYTDGLRYPHCDFVVGGRGPGDDTANPNLKGCFTVGGSHICWARGMPKEVRENYIAARFAQLEPVGFVMGGPGDSQDKEQRVLKKPPMGVDGFSLLVPGMEYSQEYAVDVADQRVQQAFESIHEPEAWSMVKDLVAKGQATVTVKPTPRPEEVNDYYHPGNFTVGGEYLGAYDRDWGRVSFNGKNAWFWGGTPATQVNPNSLAVIQPGSVPNTTTITNVENITNAGNTTVINYPAGVTPPAGSPNGNSGNPVPPGDGESTVVPGLGTYSKGTRFYEPQYPEGLSGIVEARIGEMGQTEIAGWLQGFTEVPGSNARMARSASGDMCWSIESLDFGVFETGPMPICLSNYVVLAIRSFILVLALLYCRRLVMGG